MFHFFPEKEDIFYQIQSFNNSSEKSLFVKDMGLVPAMGLSVSFPFISHG